jgi:hypothetical protein
MHQAVFPWQRARARARALLAAALVLVCGAFAASSARAATPPPSAVTCSGHVNRSSDPTLSDQLSYLLACSGSIKSFTVLSSAPIGDFEVSAEAFVHGTTTIVGDDSFFCEGLIPGDGFNCTGQAIVGHDVTSSFDLSDPVCSTTDPAAPRRPQVSVVVADWNGATAGPFRLRGPKLCPKVKPAKAASGTRHGRGHKAKRGKR